MPFPFETPAHGRAPGRGWIQRRIIMDREEREHIDELIEAEHTCTCGHLESDHGRNACDEAFCDCPRFEAITLDNFDRVRGDVVVWP